jgi:DNA-binding response OmpR family regulator
MPFTYGPVKILIIDDNRSLHTSIELALDDPHKYQLLHAYQGQQGIAFVQIHQPDLILLDLYLPDMTGLVVLERLRVMDLHIPVIFMTAMGTEAVVSQAFRLGVRDYLTKPFGLDQLEMAVENVLSTIKLEREREALKQKLLLAQGMKSTLVALSHHINNQLQIAFNSINLVEESLTNEPYGLNREQLLEVVQLGQSSLTYIADILRVLEKITSVDITNYDEETMMLDLEAAVHQQTLSQEPA